MRAGSRMEPQAQAPSVEAFWRNHVVPREPVRAGVCPGKDPGCPAATAAAAACRPTLGRPANYLQGLFPVTPDLAHLQGLWTDAYLTQTAVGGCAAEGACLFLPRHAGTNPFAAAAAAAMQGAAQVQVEQRGGAEEVFGKGRKIELSFGEALRRMGAGDASLYLTTQHVEVRRGFCVVQAATVEGAATSIRMLPAWGCRPPRPAPAVRPPLARLCHPAGGPRRPRPPARLAGG